MTRVERIAVADKIAKALRDHPKIDFSPRVWVAAPIYQQVDSPRSFPCRLSDAPVRIYTTRGEYLSVDTDGKVQKSRLNMTWGHVIDEVVESLKV